MAASHAAGSGSLIDCALARLVTTSHTVCQDSLRNCGRSGSDEYSTSNPIIISNSSRAAGHHSGGGEIYGGVGEIDGGGGETDARGGSKEEKAESYVWKKYGHKFLSSQNAKRFYYHCAERDTTGCPAKLIIDKVPKKKTGKRAARPGCTSTDLRAREVPERTAAARPSGEADVAVASGGGDRGESASQGTEVVREEEEEEEDDGGDKFGWEENQAVLDALPVLERRVDRTLTPRRFWCRNRHNHPPPPQQPLHMVVSGAAAAVAQPRVHAAATTAGAATSAAAAAAAAVLSRVGTTRTVPPAVAATISPLVAVTAYSISGAANAAAPAAAGDVGSRGGTPFGPLTPPSADWAPRSLIVPPKPRNPPVAATERGSPPWGFPPIGHMSRKRPRSPPADEYHRTTTDGAGCAAAAEERSSRGGGCWARELRSSAEHKRPSPPLQKGAIATAGTTAAATNAMMGATSGNDVKRRNSTAFSPPSPRIVPAVMAPLRGSKAGASFADAGTADAGAADAGAADASDSAPGKTDEGFETLWSYLEANMRHKLATSLPRGMGNLPRGMVTDLPLGMADLRRGMADLRRGMADVAEVQLARRWQHEEGVQQQRPDHAAHAATHAARLCPNLPTFSSSQHAAAAASAAAAAAGSFSPDVSLAASRLAPLTYARPPASPPLTPAVAVTHMGIRLPPPAHEAPTIEQLFSEAPQKFAPASSPVMPLTPAAPVGRSMQPLPAHDPPTIQQLLTRGIFSTQVLANSGFNTQLLPATTSSQAIRQLLPPLVGAASAGSDTRTAGRSLEEIRVRYIQQLQKAQDVWGAVWGAERAGAVSQADAGVNAVIGGASMASSAAMGGWEGGRFREHKGTGGGGDIGTREDAEKRLVDPLGRGGNPPAGRGVDGKAEDTHGGSACLEAGRLRKEGEGGGEEHVAVEMDLIGQLGAEAAGCAQTMGGPQVPSTELCL
ncbi:hypothetical protein CLOP_g18312 [Closterium sp. NIES-67]|nr:hypothetical protein CLOP_g18312 [Closterium sp. NIES-67]